MNDTNLTTLLQRSFHVSLGAATALVESVQDPYKREENLAKLRLDFHDLAQEWAVKGSVTESEARGLVDGLFSQLGNRFETSARSQAPASQEEASTAMRNLSIQSELQGLTAQLAAIRAELVKEDPSPQD
jgi:polyhydroxyalkanoate synthesis regulator phasin